MAKKALLIGINRYRVPGADPRKRRASKPTRGRPTGRRPTGKRNRR